ncbi:unnamed protein product, partial [Larinioides sclopetarius]
MQNKIFCLFIRFGIDKLLTKLYPERRNSVSNFRSIKNRGNSNEYGDFKTRLCGGN